LANKGGLPRAGAIWYRSLHVENKRMKRIS
jgi:hypothetical protein